MNNYFFVFVIAALISCTTKQSDENNLEKPDNAEIQELVSFKGQQVTGVTVSEKQRIFANFPRWREGVENSVVEIDANNKALPYPAKEWNSWEIDDPMVDSVFIAVQSVIASGNNLYVLDTRNPLFQGVKDAPRVFVFDLTTNKLKAIYIFSRDSYHSDSYINDLRIDKKNQKAYFTDSGHGGLVVLDLETGNTKRVLNNHSSTLAEADHLTINEKAWKNTVHSDGIALDVENELLYYHALTGFSLYAIPTSTLIYGSDEEIENSVRFVMKTPAPDGMIFDNKGNLYLADLENHRIMVLDPAQKKLRVLAEGEMIKWADTFSIYKDDLFYTNSRIHEASGDISDLVFSINRIKIN